MKLSAFLLSALFLVNTVVAGPVSPVSQDAAPSKKVIVGYFPNWLYETYLPSQINFTSYTHINYAFAAEVNGSTPIWEDQSVLDASNNYSFPTLVKLAKAAGTKVLASIGGWTGGTTFSTMAASAAGRAEFIQWNIEFIKMYDTDGVDINWEYPNSSGPGCNAYTFDDLDNLLLLIKELRAALDDNFKSSYKEITLAVYVIPTWGGDYPMSDASAFVPYVDRFYVMTYEINISSDFSGPSAPFKTQPGFGFPYGYVEGINAWHEAGVPYSKIVGGIPFYGKSETLLVNTVPSTQYNPTAPNPPLGDSDDGPFTNPYCPSDTSAASGSWKYKNLRSQGVLTTPTTAAEPWIRNFDNHTQTPWLFNPTSNTYISYDDVISVGVKTQWAIENDLAGLFCWSVNQDNGELLNVMQSVLK